MTSYRIQASRWNGIIRRLTDTEARQKRLLATVTSDHQRSPLLLRDVRAMSAQGGAEAVEVMAGAVRVGDRVSYVGVRHVHGVVTRIEHFESDIVLLYTGDLLGAFQRTEVLTKWVQA